MYLKRRVLRTRRKKRYADHDIFEYNYEDRKQTDFTAV